MKSSGDGTAFHWADGHILGVALPDIGINIDGTLSVNGSSVPFDESLEQTGGSPDSVFTGGTDVCRGDHLGFTPPIPRLPLGILFFTRVAA